MASLKTVVVLGLLFALSFAVLADTTIDETRSKEVNKAGEATADDVEPQQRGGCKRCCGAYAFGRCSACCKDGEEPQEHVAGVDTQTKEVKQGEASAADKAEPQQRGGCKRCCGAYAFGRCSACCKDEEAEVAQPQQRGCRYGCCGSYAYGRCSACCSRKMTPEESEKEANKP